jgi:2-polyprenyl-3-methyl-5-hydroxy-6-metoxy-1,4-benzoquinol methylase
MDLRELPGGQFQRHPWEVARMRFFRRVIARAGKADQPRRILDVGAGDGYLAAALLGGLPAGSEVICFDTQYTDQHLGELPAQVGGAAVSFVREPPSGLFDLMLFMDVIEHVPDDRGFLASTTARFLAPDGLVLISVPAWSSLYTKHDLFVGHHRRYRPSGLKEVVAASGLEVVEAGGLFHSLLLPRAAQKLDELRRGVRSQPAPERFGTGEQTGPGHWRAGRAVTSAITAVLGADNLISSVAARVGLGLPGLSAWALCRKGRSQ